MSTKLIPSFLRTTGVVVLLCTLVVAASLAWSFFAGSGLDGLDALEGWAVGAVVMPVFVWFMFVPLRLEYSDAQFTIEYVFGKRHHLAWTELRHYGAGRGDFMIQFAGRQAFHIFGGAYRSDDWQHFMDFLDERFPGQHTSWWIGPFGLK